MLMLQLMNGAPPLSFQRNSSLGGMGGMGGLSRWQTEQHQMQSAMSTYMPRSPFIAGRFWAVILSWAVWKKSWVGCDPTHSIIMVDRSVAITGNTTRAQLLTA